jgi:hypothetical protein
LVFTACHLLEQCVTPEEGVSAAARFASLEFWRCSPDGKEQNLHANIILASGEIDICVLSTNMALVGLKELELGSLPNDCGLSLDWSAFGFPDLDPLGFTASGTVVEPCGTYHGAPAMQLLISQGSDADWEGFSGSAIVVKGKAVGVLRARTKQVKTVWAAPISALASIIFEDESLREALRKITPIVVEHPLSTREIAPVDLRDSELTLALRTIDARPLPVECLWITGEPGAGKTCFAFRIAKSLAPGKSVFYLPRGTESSAESLAQLIQRELPEPWFRMLNENGITSLSRLASDDLLAFSVRALERSGQTVIIEAGETFLEGRDATLVELVRGLSRGNNRPRVIVTSYTCPTPLGSTHEEVPLGGLTFQDAATLIRSYCDATENECRVVYERFEGHALSIASWAVGRARLGVGSGDAELPLAAATRFQERFATLTEPERDLFCALCDYPELAIPGLLPPKDLRGLLHAGLLNRYPAVSPSGTAFYVHRLVREACYNLQPVQRRTSAGLTLLTRAIQHGIESTHLRLINAMFAADRDSEAIELVFTKGRGLLEAVGFKNLRSTLQITRVRCQAGTKEAMWARYLDGLSLLFDGQYQTARQRFERLVSEAGQIDRRCADAIKAEVLECDRRLGELSRAVSRFRELYERWSTEETGDAFSTYFVGVTGFLLAHSLRALGQHRVAYTLYDQAEQCFEKFGRESDRVEAMHCVYAKSVCILPDAIDRDGGRRYSELAAQTDSFFLRGLLHLAQARQLALREEYSDGLRELLLAKKAFSATTSVVYYQRACCAEALLRSATRDFEGALAAVHPISPERAATAAVGIVIRVVTAASARDSEGAMAILQERIPELLQRGNLATVFSLLKLLEMSGNLKISARTFQVPVLELSEPGQWEIRLRSFSSLTELGKGLGDLLSLTRTFGACITIE